jgi:hypothetical protein
MYWTKVRFVYAGESRIGPFTPYEEKDRVLRISPLGDLPYTVGRAAMRRVFKSTFPWRVESKFVVIDDHVSGFVNKDTLS